MRRHNRIPWIAGITILTGLVLFSLMAELMSLFIQGFDPTSYIAAISTLSIAILTVVYVLTTSSQLRVMQEQLNEMKTARRLESQPLPILEITKVEIEQPRLFYTPPEDQHSFHTRLWIRFSIKNHSSFPAVNVVASAFVVLRNNKDNDVVRCASERVDILAAGQEYPSNSDIKPSFLFQDDRENQILSHLRCRSLADLPVLPIHLTFCNILGGCFILDFAVQLVPKKPEDDDILKRWHSLCTSFQVQYGDDIRHMQKLRKDKKDDEWSVAFDALKDKLKAETGENALEISWMALPGTFKVRSISSEDYQRDIKQTGFGHPVPAWIEKCIHKNEE